MEPILQSLFPPGNKRIAKGVTAVKGCEARAE
jgi:hypothetical protein